DTVQPPTIFDEVGEEDARQRVVSTWRRCAQETADKGMYVTWEFEPGFAFNKPSDILRIVEEVNEDNFGVLFDTCHAHMVAAVGARQPGEIETLPGGALELAQKLRGKINHLHLIDSDGTLHNEETSTHAPFGEGLLDFDELIPELNACGVPHDWWTIDLCFCEYAWDATEKCKAVIDELNKKFNVNTR
ncbi:MAG: TIM barrel protein, partial [Candidatus Hydrogenedentes bacterium]|nr:TIM barrel protein [Candidatus Hydrogenedentota bacterium]